jgi:hypothetical protein
MKKTRADINLADVHKDFLGNELVPTDYVLTTNGHWTTGSHFAIATVVELTGKMVKFKIMGQAKTKLQYANALLKISSEDVLMYALRNGSS